MAIRIRSKQRGGTPTTLGELVRAAYPSREPDEVAAVRVFHAWRRAVPERIYRRARPVRLHAGTLYVNTDTSAWASELEYMKEELLARVRTRAPEVRVRALRFRVGPLPELLSSPRPERRAPSPVIVATVPEPLARALAGIQDDELREAIGAAACVALGRDAKRR